MAGHKAFFAGAAVRLVPMTMIIRNGAYRADLGDWKSANCSAAVLLAKLFAAG